MAFLDNTRTNLGFWLCMILLREKLECNSAVFAAGMSCEKECEKSQSNRYFNFSILLLPATPRSLGCEPGATQGDAPGGQ